MGNLNQNNFILKSFRPEKITANEHND